METNRVRLIGAGALHPRPRRFWKWFTVAIFSLALSTSLTVAAVGPIRVMLNGGLLPEDLSAVDVDGVLMVPLAPIADALGAEFAYDEESRLVTISLAAEGPPSDSEQPKTTVEEGDIIVFIAKSGTKYHRQDCRYLSSGGESIALGVAKQRGYQPCKVCAPPE